MNRSVRTAPWIAGAALLALLILAGAWFLGVSPQLDAAAEDREQAEFERNRADLLQLQLAALRADFERMPEYTATLADLQEQIPDRLALAPLTRAVEATAARTGVHVLAMNPALPLPIEVAAPDPGASTTEQTANDAGGDEAETSGQPAPPAAPTFYGTPIEVLVLGGYQEAFDFVREMQTGSDRLLLVTGIDVSAQEESGASGGRPETRPGDVEIKVSLLAFTRLTAEVTPPAVSGSGTVEVTDGPARGSLPVPGAGSNPFAVAQ